MAAVHSRTWPGRPAAVVLAAVLLTGTAAAAAGAPRFMVIIDEKNLGAYTVAESEKTVTTYLLSRGQDVVDAEVVRTTVNRDRALQAMISGPRAAAALGLQFGAEVIVVGTAVAKGSAEPVEETSFRSYQAQVSLKAIRTDTAEVLAFESASAAKIHVDDVVGGSQAIRDATERITPALIDRVLEVWGAPPAGGSRAVQLVVGDVNQVWQVAALKELLRKKVPGVEEVVQRSFVSGVAVFDVRYAGDSQRLAEELTLADPGYFRLAVAGVSPRKLDVKLIESPPQ